MPGAASVIRAAGLVPAPAPVVFAYLADLGRHWELADRFIEVVELERAGGGDAAGPATGGRVRLRGPLGLRRTAVTAVDSAEPSTRMAGTARLGRRTAAAVSWTLAPRGVVTSVTLEATVLDAGPLDRLLLRLGGRAWLARRFAAILERLARIHSAEGRAARLRRASAAS
jgi:hypothetical protein